MEPISSADTIQPAPSHRNKSSEPVDVSHPHPPQESLRTERHQSSFAGLTAPPQVRRSTGRTVSAQNIPPNVQGDQNPLTAYSPAALQSCAAGLSVAAGVFARSNTIKQMALQATQALSGATWAAADGMAQLHHMRSPGSPSYLTSASNLLGAIAGTLSIGSALVPGVVGLSSGYASATAWLLNACTSAATINQLTSQSARYLLGSSAIVNGTAAALSECAEDAQRHAHSDRAATLAIASGSVWLAGAALAACAAHQERQTVRRESSADRSAWQRQPAPAVIRS